MDRFFALLSDPHRLSITQACRIAHRGWLIERARTKRLRKKLGEAQRLAEMHRDAYRDLHTDIYPSTNIPRQCGPMFWEADQAAKGGE